MTDSRTRSLISTKIQRPRVGRDLVQRPRLLEQLTTPAALTLVIAPAGYGKTTLLSAWLDNSTIPSAWLSLDPQDSDLIIFTTYLVAAVQTLFPAAGAETVELLNGVTRPPLAAITRSLLNALESIEQEFILVLDDYHVIQDNSVHELITELVRYSPRNLCLVMAARFDPPLPLSSFRARGQFTELRAVNLCFTVEEATRLLRDNMQLPIDDQAVALLRTRTEGWAVALRLAALYYRHRGRLTAQDLNQNISNRYVMSYLAAEVLTQLPTAIQDFLLKTSILDRLCGPLCEAITGVDDPECNGHAYLEWLEQADLFLTPLGDERDWFRYHPLFQEFLHQQLAQQHVPAEIGALHIKASAWFAANGYLDEALHHALASGNAVAAAQIVAQHRHELMNQGQWQRLERWHHLFPRQVVNEQPNLLLIEIWLKFIRQQLSEIPPLLDQVEGLLPGLPPDPAARLQGEVDARRGALLYWSGEMTRSHSVALQALEKIPADWWYIRGFTRLWVSLGCLASGDLAQAYAALYATGEPDPSRSYHNLLTGLACFIHWISADLMGLAKAARQVLATSDPSDPAEIVTFSQYHAGLYHYQLNNLAVAEEYLRPLTLQPYRAHALCFLNSAVLLARIRQTQGQIEEAREIVDVMLSIALETHSDVALFVARAFQAELALRQGRLAEAGQWAAQNGSFRPGPMPFVFSPPIALAQILIAQDTPASRQQARHLLAQLDDYNTSIHYTVIRIQVLALQALLHQAEGNELQALAALSNSIALAEPGGFIRLFVDLGEPLERLLTTLVREKAGSSYAAQILAAFPQTFSPMAAHRQANEALVSPLTPRELDVLTLLDKRYTDREIAETLVISAATVRSHVQRIGDKLGTHGRHAIVQAAKDQGLL